MADGEWLMVMANGRGKWLRFRPSHPAIVRNHQP
jgi:hypothetical protein